MELLGIFVTVKPKEEALAIMRYRSVYMVTNE